MKSDFFAWYVQQYFLRYLKVQRGCLGNTTSSYSTTFSLFLRFLDIPKVDLIRLVDIDRKKVIGFLDWLHVKRGNSNSSSNVRLAHIKSFFHFVLMEEPAYADLCASISRIPFKNVTKKPPQSLSKEMLSKILAMPGTRTRKGLHDSAMLALLYDSACRVQELIDIKIQDIHMERHCYVFVHGKGDKYRNIPLMDSTAKLLKTYITRFGLSDRDLLFESRTGGKLTRQGVSYILNKYVLAIMKENPSLVDPDVSISPHIMRHSKATHLVESGVHIFNVRDFLGHVSVSTTQVYLTSNPEHSRKSLEQAAEKIGVKINSSYSKKETTALQKFLDSLA